MQINVARVPPVLDIPSIIASAESSFNKFFEQINSIDIKKIYSATSEYDEEFNKIFSLYQTTHYKFLNILEIKSKK